jgi:simple sugar transport system ATP-binding protein
MYHQHDGVTMNSVPILEARRIIRRFGHVEALRGADFAVYPGEIVALIGDNGAGKSTLVKIMSGADQPTEGQILVDGNPVSLTSPESARELGIETVYQDLALAPDLDPSANLFLGREILRPGFLGSLGVLDKKEMARRGATAVKDLGALIKDLGAPVSELSGGQRQSVAVVRAAMWAKRVIFMDEPTAALGVVQTQSVLDLIRRVRDQGIAVVLISHNMQQVLEIADRIEVLRLGQRVDRADAKDATVETLVAAMTSGTLKES